MTEVIVRLQKENAGAWRQTVWGLGKFQRFTGGKAYTLSVMPSCAGPGSYRTLVTAGQPRTTTTKSTITAESASDPVDLTCS
jgi:hypothetical protein